MRKNTIGLWYDNDAEAAASFYAKTFPDSEVEAIHHAPSDYPNGKKGDLQTVGFWNAAVRSGLPRISPANDLAAAATLVA